MKDTLQNKNLTLEEVLQDPSFAYAHDLIRYVQNTPASQMFPKKHEMGLTYVVESKTRKLFNENPNMPIKTVITTVFEPLTDDIPAPLALKLTQKIIEKWESLSVSLRENNEIMAVV